MVSEFLPFRIALEPVMIAGSCLWSLALYLGWTGMRHRVIDQLDRWFNFAGRSLYTSRGEETRGTRESQNAFYASVFSILPFLAIGGLCNWGVKLGLGASWSISVGIIACIACGVYELGRQDGSR